MTTSPLDSRVQFYDEWKQTLADQILAYRAWLFRYHFLTEELRGQIRQSLDKLQNDEITLAIVGELSRGKTALINALFYDKYRRELLPSLAGRTTMCPTELYFDPLSSTEYLKLLPIETRRTSSTVASFKRSPEKWVTIELPKDDPEKVTELLQHVADIKEVPLSVAKTLGFNVEALEFSTHTPNYVRIPSWRHALINLDHSLLRKRLRIIDTPGLNSLGNEPELTLSTLPNVHALIFLLSADSGATTSDMKIWQYYMRDLQQQGNLKLVAALNKIDTLWNEMEAPETTDTIITDVVTETAERLQLHPDEVFPLSARQGLLAKERDNDYLLRKSRLNQLETVLSDSIASQQQQLFSQGVILELRQMMGDSRQLVQEHKDMLQRELDCLLSAARSKSALEEQIHNLREQVFHDHRQYHSRATELKSSANLVQQHAQTLLQRLSPCKLSTDIDRARNRLRDSWRSKSAAGCIDYFLDKTERRLLQLATEAEQSNSLIAAIYSGDTSLSNYRPLRIDHLISSQLHLRHRVEHFKFPLLQRAYREPTIRFFNSIANETYSIQEALRKEIRQWAEQALLPLVQQNTQQKIRLEQYMQTLSALSSQLNNNQDKVRQLQTDLEAQVTALEEIDQLINEIELAQWQEIEREASLIDASATLHQSQ